MSTYSFKHKTAIITGGASGIGFAAASQLAENGANVVIADISEKREEVAAELSNKPGAAQSCQVNVTDPSSIGDMITFTKETFGSPHILIHCAGIGIEKDFLNTTLEEWQRIIDVDLTGTFLCAQAVAKEMMSLKYGRIVTIASTAGVAGSYKRGAYGAAKGGVISLTKVMATELAPFGITANALAPGAIETELVKEMHSDATRRIYTDRIPTGRYGTPEETAATAVFLASEEAAYVNGHVLNVDGGFLSAGLMEPSSHV